MAAPRLPGPRTLATNLRKRRCLLPLAVAAAVSFPTAAVAQPVLDRAQVGVPGKRSPTRGFSENLSVAMTAPAGYERSCCADFVSGAWDGPQIHADGAPAGERRARIEWSVAFERSRARAAKLARSAGWADYPQIAAGRRRVPHVVGGRRVGTLRAAWAIDAQAAPGARVQGAVAIFLGRRVHAVTLFHLPDPPSDQDSTGTLTVAGQPGSKWNRNHARAALDAVYVEGSLPPARVKARVRGRKVSGTVQDTFAQPVSEVEIVLQRRAGSRWRGTAKGKTSTRGTYSLRAPRPGAYRVVASLAGSSAKSRPVPVGG